MWRPCLLTNKHGLACETFSKICFRNWIYFESNYLKSILFIGSHDNDYSLGSVIPWCQTANDLLYNPVWHHIIGCSSYLELMISIFVVKSLLKCLSSKESSLCLWNIEVQSTIYNQKLISWVQMLWWKKISHLCWCIPKDYFDGLEQECSNSIANALELRLLSWTKPLIW